MRGMSIRSACCGVLLAISAVSGCATSRSDFVVALPNGYQIIRDKSAAPMIVKKSGGTVVPGPVARYAVVRDVVVGVVAPEGEKLAPALKPATDAKPASDAKAASGQPAAAQKTGYFVLNTRTGELGKDLAESAYTERLKSLNIPTAPELSPPVLPQ
jgi:hypothetical protein